MTPKQIADYLIQNRRSLRARKDSPCPVCGKAGEWCLRLPDGSACLCPRSDNGVKRYGEYGFLHLLASGSESQATMLPPVVKKPERTDVELDAVWRPRAELWCERGRIEQHRLAQVLGVSVLAVRELCVGWDGRAWTTPERNGEGLIVGVSRRFEDGTKRFARGGRRGLTYSDGWQDCEGPALIVEGASDVLAGITLKLATIGRPSNTGGLRDLTSLLDGCRRRVVVVAERDLKPNGRWPGKEGATTILDGLRKVKKWTVSSRLLPDGAKDLRAWLNGRRIDGVYREAWQDYGTVLRRWL